MGRDELGFYQQLFAEDDLYILEEGNELKDTCLVLDKKLSAKNEVFLGKILAAVNQSLFSVSKLHSPSVQDIDGLKTKVALIFDDDAFANIPFYEITKIGSLSILKANSLDKINADKALKGDLWVQLQKLF